MRGRAATGDKIINLLRGLTILLCFSAVLISALAYPWRLPDKLLEDLEVEYITGKNPTGWYGNQFRSQLVYTHSPLVYKESVAQGFLLASLASFFVLLALQAARSANAQSLSWQERIRRLIRDPQAWSLLMFAYFLLGIHGIPGSPGKTVLQMPGSPTYHYSLRTLFAMSLGWFMILAIARLRPGRRWQAAFMAAITLSGFIIAGIALLQHVGAAKWFLPTMEDPRNRMSSLIGHNTGMSSWLLFPLSFSLYFAFANRWRLVRALAWCFSGLIVFVIIAAQSRAIWALAAVVSLVSIFAYFRIFSRRVRATYALAAAAICLTLIAALTVAPKHNPLARLPVSLAARLEKDVFNLDQLLRETRLRIVTVSFAELVIKKPLVGTGLGTFQWFYPEAQGKYLKGHPKTRLGYTTKRTDLAHNDYLQLLIETGLIGLGMAAVVISLLFRRGWKALRSMPVPHDRARQLAFAIPAAACGVHALVDFPLHVVPIALLCAACVGFWAAPGFPDEREIESEPRVGPSALRWRYVSALSAAGVCLFWIPFAYKDLIYREFVSDIYTSNGSNWLLTARAVSDQGTDQQFQVLMKAQGEFRQAIHANVFSGAAYEGMASTYSSLGNLAFTTINRAAASGSTSTAALLRDSARSSFESVIQYADLQTTKGELRYHYSYYMPAHAYRMLWLLKPDLSDPRQAQYLKSAVQGFEKAIDFNMADSNSLTEITETLETMPQPDFAGAAKYRQLLFRIDPTFASKNVLEPLLKHAACGNTTFALERLSRLNKQIPDSPLVTEATAMAHLYAAVWPPASLDLVTDATSAPLSWRKARLAPGWKHLQALESMSDQQDAAMRVYMLYVAAEGDFAKAEQYADGILVRDPDNAEAKGMKTLAQNALNQDGGETFSFKPAVDEHRFWFAICFGPPREKASGMVGIYTQLRNGWKVDLPRGIRAAQAYRNNGDHASELGILSALSKRYPSDPLLNSYLTAAQQP